MNSWSIGSCAAMLTVAALALEAAEPASPQPAPDHPPAGRFQEAVEVRDELPAVPPAQLVTLKASADVQTTPASVTIVPEALSKSQDARVLTDALENAAGVNVATGFGVFDYFTLRGLDSLSGGLVVVDGAPEPESTFYPLYNVRQVELLKGPAAFAYGGNPLAGAVHLVRKQPLAEPRLDASLSYGSFGSKDAALDGNVASRDGRLALRVNGLYRESDGWRDDKPSRVFALNPALLFRPDERTRLALNAEYARSEYTPDSGLPVPAGLSGVPRERSYQSPFDVSEQDLWRLRLDGERRVDERLTLRAKLYATSLDWRSEGTLVLGAFPGGSDRILVPRVLPLLDDRQGLRGAQLEALVDFQTGRVKHEALFGFEAGRLKDDYTLDVAYLPPLDLTAPVESAVQPLFLLPGQSAAGDARNLTLAPYVLDRLTLSERWRLTLGARLDRLDYDERFSATAREDTRLSPLAGLTFSPRPHLSLYVSGGTAFAPPSTLVVGPRDPERSRQVEAGAKLTFLGGRAFLGAAAYHLERDNIAIPDQSGVLRQQGDQRSRGIELELSAEARPGWTTFASFAVTDAELTRFFELLPTGGQSFVVLDRSGNHPAFVPRTLASLWTVKEWKHGLELGAGLRYVGMQHVAEDNALELPAYALVDARVAYRRGPARLSVNLKNLTDHEYFTRGNGGASLLPGEPFAAYARIELSFGGR